MKTLLSKRFKRSNVVTLKQLSIRPHDGRPLLRLPRAKQPPVFAVCVITLFRCVMFICSRLPIDMHVR
jgi:hypothetical protein